MVGDAPRRKILPSVRENHPVAQKMGQELGRGEMVFGPLPTAKSSPCGPAIGNSHRATSEQPGSLQKYLPQRSGKIGRPSELAATS
jgi:hypothetical protein